MGAQVNVAVASVPGIVSGWIPMATTFVCELTLSVVLSRPVHLSRKRRAITVRKSAV